MKFKIFGLLLGVLMVAVVPKVHALENEMPVTLTEPSQEEVRRLSETFGHLIASTLDAPGMKFDVESVIKGMRDNVQGEEPPMTEEEYQSAINELQEHVFTTIAESNLMQADAFMLLNKGSDGIVEVEPGKLQYQIVREGVGEEVQEHTTPLIHYTGRFVDGSVFGSSVEAGDPIPLVLDETIPGFSKGLVGMKEGENRTLFIHPDLAYQTSGQLPPNSLLIFEVECIKIDANGLNMDEIGA